MKRRSDVEAGGLAEELAALTAPAPERLKEHWRTLYGNEPPRRISEDLLRRAVAYRIQENALGGLKPSTRRLLERVAPHGDGGPCPAVSTTPTRKLRPGAVLIREWHGTGHEVTVLDDGVSFQGKRYRSLSEVARKITGAHWSGPLFFGLRASEQENHNGAG